MVLLIVAGGRVAATFGCLVAGQKEHFLPATCHLPACLRCYRYAETPQKLKEPENELSVKEDASSLASWNASYTISMSSQRFQVVDPKNETNKWVTGSYQQLE